MGLTSYFKQKKIYHGYQCLCHTTVVLVYSLSHYVRIILSIQFQDFFVADKSILPARKAHWIWMLATHSGGSFFKSHFKVLLFLTTCGQEWRINSKSTGMRCPNVSFFIYQRIQLIVEMQNGVFSPGVKQRSGSLLGFVKFLR